MIDINSLPGKEKTIKILNRDRLNFRAQSIDCEPMNSRQQSSVAPFLFGCCRVEISRAEQNLLLRVPAMPHQFLNAIAPRCLSARRAVTGPQTSIRPRTSSRIASARSQFFPRSAVRSDQVALDERIWDKSLGASEAVPQRSRMSLSGQRIGLRRCSGAFASLPHRLKAAQQRRTPKPRGHSDFAPGQASASPDFHPRASSQAVLHFRHSTFAALPPASSRRAASAHHAIHRRWLLRAMLLFATFSIAAASRIPRPSLPFRSEARRV